MLSVVSTSDANFSPVGALLLSAVQKVVNDIKHVSTFYLFIHVILWFHTRLT